MAITRTQIAKQLLKKGGPAGGQTGSKGGYSDKERGERQAATRSRNVQSGGRQFDTSTGPISPGTDVTGGFRDDNPFNEGPPSQLNPPPKKVKVPPKKPKETNINKFKRAITTYGPLSYLDKLTNSKLARFNNSLQRQNYINSLDLTNPEEKEEYDRIMNQLGGLGMDIIAGPTDLESTMLSVPPSMLATDPMTQFKTVDGVSTLGNPGVDDVLGEGYEEYLDRNNTTTGGGGRDNQVMDPCLGPNPPAYCFIGEKADETMEAQRNLGGLAPRFAGSIFDFTGLADGGRVAAQQGGIMPRLNDLSGGVSSAEQMLQEINQRLESAESSLGSGGGQLTQLPVSGTLANLASSTPSVQTPNPNAFAFKDPVTGGGQPFFGNMNPSSADLSKPLGGTFDGQQFDSVKSAYDYAVKSAADQRAGGFMGRIVLPGEMGFEGFSDLFNRQNDPNAQQPISVLSAQGGLGGGVGSPIQQAVGMADGGRVPAMDGGIMNADVIGGAADGNIDEMGRQMYFVGKLVKKATRAVKKIAKSPIGKIGLMYGLGAMGGSFGAGKGFFSKGMFNPANIKAGLLGTKASMAAGPMKYLQGTPFTEGLLGKLGITKGGGSFMPTLKGGIGLGLGVPLALDLLGVGKDDDDKMDLDEYYRTQGINIADIRLNPYNYLAPRFAADGGLMRTGYQEGGDAEPVAKKTMPLIDMDGKEKDYRETGGFVDMGRMERADDVPARLSKNEFVFTADAVRNAGEGDIDKGAEVMYNMMKNLEAGGEVSEESQGLEGARKMFQTSQRLGEVL